MCIRDSYDAGLRVVNVSNPTNCVPVGDYPNGLYGYANGLAVVGNMIYLADGESGLAVLASLQNVQFTLRVDCLLYTSSTLRTS